MIPKTIHYCWFGKNPLPALAQKCISSWQKFLPDYEIKEWNEDNFDVNIIPYTRQAYEAKKYAFVSDYARFWILYHYGGLYFDTDVEIIKPMDDIIGRGAFMGLEKKARLDGKPMVNPGLGLGTEPNNRFYHTMLEDYADRTFILPDGNLNTSTIVEYTTRRLYSEGMNVTVAMQEVCGIWIYPEQVFCPMDSTTGIIRITPETVSVHHYDCSWIDHKSLRFKLHLLKNHINRTIDKLKR